MTEVALTIALASSIGLNVCFAVILFRQSVNTSVMLDRAHDRTTTYTRSLVDRLMAMDFATFKQYQLLESSPETQEESNEPAVPEFTDGPDKGGFASKLGLRALSDRQYVGDDAHVRATEELLESELPR